MTARPSTSHARWLSKAVCRDRWLISCCTETTQRVDNNNKDSCLEFWSMWFQFERLRRFIVVLIICSLFLAKPSTAASIQLQLQIPIQLQNCWKELQSTMGATLSVTQWYVHGKKHFTRYVVVVVNRLHLNYDRNTADSLELGNWLHGTRLCASTRITPHEPCTHLHQILSIAIHYPLFESHRTGYERHVKAYTSPVQSSASIRRGEPGADGVDMEGKVVVITGYVKQSMLDAFDIHW